MDYPTEEKFSRIQNKILRWELKGLSDECGN